MVEGVTWGAGSRVPDRREVHESAQLRHDAGARSGAGSGLQLSGDPFGQRLEQEGGGLGHLLAGACVIDMLPVPGPAGTMGHGNARLDLPGKLNR